MRIPTYENIDQIRQGLIHCYREDVYMNDYNRAYVALLWNEDLKRLRVISGTDLKTLSEIFEEGVESVITTHIQKEILIPLMMAPNEAMRAYMTHLLNNGDEGLWKY